MSIFYLASLANQTCLGMSSQKPIIQVLTMKHILFKWNSHTDFLNADALLETNKPLKLLSFTIQKYWTIR